MTSKRTIITIPDPDKRWLESYSRLHRISMAEAIRRGIRKLKEAELAENYQSQVMNTKGRSKGGNGLAYQHKIRDEWDSR